jgi:glycosyltransferase involved in cell wall biosynthesis
LDGRRLLLFVNVGWFFLSHRLPVAIAARQAGMDVHVAADVEHLDESRAVAAAGLTFHRIHLARSGLSPLAEVGTMLGMARVCARLRPDVVHNVTSKPVMYGSLVAKAFRVPGVVNAVSGFGYAYGSASGRHLLAAMMDRAYRRAFSGERVRVIVQNDEDAAEVTRICPAAAGRINLIRGSGVDLDEFRASPEPAGTVVVVLPARMLRDKGVLEFCEAADRLRRDGVAARFVLAGRVDRSNRSGLTESELAELSRNTGVQWLGDCRDMPALLRDSHIVCLPTYYREGVPKALLEACASQRPIVTTDVPGCRDVVAAGANGILVPPRDPVTLAHALRSLIENAPMRRQMGCAGRALAEREFDSRQVAAGHLQIYQDLLQRSSAG